MENEELKQNIMALMQAFTNQELGNKITTFNMSGLANMLMGVIDGNVQLQRGPAPVEQNFPTAQVDLDIPDTEEIPTADEVVGKE
jgi:hypothetical protein